MVAIRPRCNPAIVDRGMCYANIRRKMEEDFRFPCLGAIQPVGHLDLTLRRGQPHFPYMLDARIDGNRHVIL